MPSVNAGGRGTLLRWQSVAGSRSSSPFRPLSWPRRSEEHTSELQSPCNLVCRLLLEKKKKQHSRSAPLGITCAVHIRLTKPPAQSDQRILQHAVVLDPHDHYFDLSHQRDERVRTCST